jgi:hypothetical protein
MRIDDDARLYLTWTATVNQDPSAGTIVLDIDGTPYPMTWQDAAVESGGKWTRTAQTDDLFVGTSATPEVGDVELTAGTHIGEAILTLPDGQIVPARPFTFYVR